MGRATKLKNESLAIAEAEVQQNFADRTKAAKLRASAPVPDVSKDFKEYEGFFVRDKESFSLKTKSKNRDKQRQEFVRHAFHLYPVPAFMFNAWETKKPPLAYYGREKFDFDTKEDYRLWYICIATGGSFYKEYGQYLFTKKECHVFLNCKHEIPIKQAIIYSIAYAESNSIGKSLRISKTKVNTFNLPDDFWGEVIRFFARQESESKEQLDDIVDYIVYRRRENPDFTIIGKGHTVESLTKKVTEWHQDLRRLKVIGDHFWEGIPVKDSQYSQKNPNKHDNTVNVWKFTQIKSAKDLQKEGNAMRHCVLSYKNDCIEGKSSIWSLTLNDHKKLTIEVRGSRIAQVRGLANRIARDDEINVVKKWARDFRFSYNN